MRVNEARKKNLGFLVRKHGGVTRLANVIGMSQSQLCHLVGPNPLKNIGNYLSLKIEKVLGLPDGWLDKVHDDDTVNYSPSFQETFTARTDREIRRQNLRFLVHKHGGTLELANITGVSRTTISCVVSLVNSSANLGSKVAEKIEKALGLAAGWFDAVHDEVVAYGSSLAITGHLGMREVRRQNLRFLVHKHGGITSFSNLVDMSQSQGSHLIGANPTKNIGNGLAYKIETKLGLPVGWLDKMHDDGDDAVDYAAFLARPSRKKPPCDLLESSEKLAYELRHYLKFNGINEQSIVKLSVRITQLIDHVVAMVKEEGDIANEDSDGNEN